jgi:hypothetical protein
MGKRIEQKNAKGRKGDIILAAFATLVFRNSLQEERD